VKSWMLAFDCGGRRGKLGANVPKELEAMKAVAGDVPIFGFYGSGEIGRVDADTASRGDGYHLSATAIILD
jgi:small ligand-binding sensory domain FIST